MSRTAWLLLAIVSFTLVGTANSGGYRFGASDQAFYAPAIALRADPALFPRDRAVLEPQMRFWIGDELLGLLVRATGISLPMLFLGLYALTMAALTLGAVWLARALGCDWWTIAVALVLLTLRHRIARTGANSLEGYMHPRMLAFAIGLAALACTTRTRHAAALALTAVAAVAHSSTAIWFAGVAGVAAIWPRLPPRRAPWIAAGALVAGGVVAAALPLPVMDRAWLDVLGDRDYLFSADWPAYAWIANLAYPVVIVALHRRRRTLGVAVPGETALVAGLLALVAGFLVTLPLAEAHVALFVQLQANRVFWLLDAVVAIYVAWWLVADLARDRALVRRALPAALICLAVARGAYVLADTNRPLFQVQLPSDSWTDVMRWLGTQPASWHVLADPGHAWLHGTSIRAAARRDTFLELGKDPAMAMYDRALAARVAERRAALEGFGDWSSAAEVRGLAARYDLDVFVDRTDRRFDLPVLFVNDDFVVYDLR